MKAFVLFGLILLASAARLRLPVDEQLAMIDSTEYGKRLLDTIDLQMQSGASVDKIIALLDELSEEMQGEQAEDDKLNVTRQQECDDEISEFNRRIDAAEGEIADASARLADLRPRLVQTKNEKAVKATEIDSLNAEISGLKQAHNGDSGSYDDRIAEHKSAIDAIDESIVELNKLVGSTSGQGVHETSDLTAAEKRDLGVFAQVKTLVKLASKADQGAVQKVIDYLNEIRANLVDSIADEQNTHVQAIEDYDGLLAKMEQTLRDLESAHVTLAEQEESLSAEIGRQEERLSAAQDELTAATNARDAKVVQCNNWSNKYLSDSAQRAGELDVVSQAREIFVNKLGGMSDYLSERVES